MLATGATNRHSYQLFGRCSMRIGLAARLESSVRTAADRRHHLYSRSGRHSSAVEQLFRKQQVLGSNPSVGSTPLPSRSGSPASPRRRSWEQGCGVATTLEALLTRCFAKSPSSSIWVTTARPSCRPALVRIARICCGRFQATWPLAGAGSISPRRSSPRSDPRSDGQRAPCSDHVPTVRAASSQKLPSRTLLRRRARLRLARRPFPARCR